MSTPKYRIEDWAGNILCYDGLFRLSELAVPMLFNRLEDGVEHIDVTPVLDECREDLYVEVIK